MSNKARAITFLASAAASMCLFQGCYPAHSTFEARSLSGRPIPPGKIAMLPLICGPEVQDQMMALAFSKDLLGALQEKNIDVVYEDLGGTITPEVWTEEKAKEAAQRGMVPSTRTLERYRLLRQAGFRTACRLGVRRYGYYQINVPPTPILLPTFGASKASATAYDSYGGSAWGTGHSSYQGYTATILPGHTRQVPVVSAELHVVDVQSEEEIYYFVAACADWNMKPSRLEQAVIRGFVKKFKLSVSNKPVKRK